MSDHEIIRKLEEKVGRPFPYILQDGRCVELSFCDAATIFNGLVRHHTPGAKLEMLRLVAQLKSLRKLNLRRNCLGGLPPEFGGLTQLEDLSLGSNYLGEVPEFIRGFKKLKCLLMGNNDLVTLPGWLSELTELEHIAVHKNVKLKSVEALRGLKRLRTLNLYYVNLLELPRFVYDFTSLTTLTLWNVKQFSHGLIPFEHLEFYTNCGGPGVRSLPEGFTGLRKLRMARLFQNNLETLPEDLGNLEKLEQISVYQNRLTRLPDSMARLQNLTKLNIGWNRFKVIPEWLNDLKSLKYLAIFENPLAQSDPIKDRSGLKIDREWPFTTVGISN